ncbi:MAG: SMP-30/gluconolactonase/LRE family protein [Labilithrix sp.]|nr:SMP-30/gluconolactonase/LRE family protein [Labilithrix sp.]
MKTIHLLLVLPIGLGVFSLSSCKSDEETAGENGIDPEELKRNPIQAVGAPRLLIETGQYTDGPVWQASEKVLFFTVPFGEGDIPGLYRVRPDGSAMKVRGGDLKSGQLPVGNAVTKSGELVTAEAKRLIRGDATVATGYPEGAFDTLKGVVVHKNGTMYVTDPGYFVDPPPTANRLYRVAPDGVVTVAEQFQDVPRPNGVALSPNQDLLYVGFEKPTAGTKPYLEKYHVLEDGALAEHSRFAELDMDSSPDGIEVDMAGNVYVANKAGVTVFKPDGKKIGNVAVPDQPTGLAFGGDDLKTLFITTAKTKIFTIKVNVTGINQ